MTHAEAFLADVIEHPDDDVVRLVFADWLEDHGGEARTDWLEDHGGEARAEFLRVQIELAVMGASADDVHCPSCDIHVGDCHLQGCRYLTLQHREDDLIRHHAWRWLRDTLPDDLHRDYDRWTHKGGQIQSKRQDNCSLCFRRGFVEALTLSAEDWLLHADALTVAAPIREVWLTTFPQMMYDFRSDTTLYGIAALKFRLPKHLRDRITFHLPS